MALNLFSHIISSTDRFGWDLKRSLSNTVPRLTDIPCLQPIGPGNVVRDWPLMTHSTDYTAGMLVGLAGVSNWRTSVRKCLQNV